MKAFRLFAVSALLACLCMSSVAFAADDAPRKAERRTPVVVEFEGDDSIGTLMIVQSTE